MVRIPSRLWGAQGRNSGRHAGVSWTGAERQAASRGDARARGARSAGLRSPVEPCHQPPPLAPDLCDLHLRDARPRWTPAPTPLPLARAMHRIGAWRPSLRSGKSSSLCSHKDLASLRSARTKPSNFRWRASRPSDAQLLRARSARLKTKTYERSKALLAITA